MANSLEGQRPTGYPILRLGWLDIARKVRAGVFCSLVCPTSGMLLHAIYARLRAADIRQNAA